MSENKSKSFVEKLTNAVERNNSLLCVGLDPDPHNYPEHFPETIDTEALVAWGKGIIEKTADLVCCYKPNFAFYEQFGPSGLEALRQTIAAVPHDIPILLDAKRGDIGSTAVAYARAAFEVWGADAITVNPYLGRDGITPFLEYPGKMVFILVYTSNPSAKDIQEFAGPKQQLYENIVHQAQSWGSHNQIGFVIGATQPDALVRARVLMPNHPHWILAPGVGAQGGRLQASLLDGLDDNGSSMIIPVSRSVIYAKAPQASALSLRGEINQIRQRIKLTHRITLLQHELIQQLYEIGCIQFGEFTLASGQQSPIYFDLQRLSADPLFLKMAALAYADLLKPLRFDHLAAVPYAALTIGTALALSMDSSLIYPHKEMKPYGTDKAVEGVFSPGERAVVIEDLITTGGSVMKAIKTLEGVGLAVSDIVVLVDREQGGRQFLIEKGYQVHVALRMTEILDVLQESGQITGAQVVMVRNFIKENSI